MSQPEFTYCQEPESFVNRPDIILPCGCLATYRFEFRRYLCGHHYIQYLRKLRQVQNEMDDSNRVLASGKETAK